ncbi:MAG: dan 2 [Caulobacteraceae bacterium]|jgi:N-acyl-D-amino-acid deacylase|nr:dan 2 [Caulobacteraceae bacterium]
MHDLIIRNAHIVDGTGARPFDADLAIDGGHIAMIGKVAGEAARETIDADGRMVTPGFVDIHTHYDGQATWDTDMKPSSQHGVTTVVMGNCGVGFAPVRPGAEPWLIALMEGVEDIPGAALTEGMKWGWESFPEYLDVLDQQKLAIDIAAQVPHGALRGYVMGERGANNEPATPEEIAVMGRLVREAIEAGAVGFSTSRIMGHQGLDGRPVPGTLARKDELLAIASGMRQAGKGVFEIIPSGTIGELPGLTPDPYSVQEEMVWMREFAAESGRPLTFTLAQIHSDPRNYLDLLRLQDEAVAAGLPIHGQYNTRPGGVLTGLQSYHAFQARATYKALAHLPLAQRAAEMRKPEVRSAILSEPDIPASASISDGFALQIQNMIPYIYPLTAPLDYEPDISRSIAAQARARGVDPLAHMYDLLVEGDGSAVFIALAANFADNDHRAIEIMLRNPNAVPGLADGGAHARLICDASNSTYLLTHWARDRRRGPKFPIEMLVKKQASDTARLYGFEDRGTLEVGKRADLNIIDFDRLSISAPRMVNDLPAGGARYLQESQGYDFTFVNGVATRRDGEDSGARPGGLVRSGAAAARRKAA